jgi:hypothetical protein
MLEPAPHPRLDLEVAPREIPEVLHGGAQQAQRAPALAAAAGRRARRRPQPRHLPRPQVPIERQAHRLLRLLVAPAEISPFAFDFFFPIPSQCIPSVRLPLPKHTQGTLRVNHQCPPQEADHGYSSYALLASIVLTLSAAQELLNDCSSIAQATDSTKLQCLPGSEERQEAHAEAVALRVCG